MDISEKVFKVTGQRSRSWPEQSACNGGGKRYCAVDGNYLFSFLIICCL